MRAAPRPRPSPRRSRGSRPHAFSSRLTRSRSFRVFSRRRVPVTPPWRQCHSHTASASANSDGYTRNSMGNRLMVRKADPYRDTDVIAASAPRTNQAIVGPQSLLAVLTGWWPILGLLAGQLAIGLAFGRRYCIPCLLYFEVIQPRIGE